MISLLMNFGKTKRTALEANSVEVSVRVCSIETPTLSSHTHNMRWEDRIKRDWKEEEKYGQ